MAVGVGAGAAKEAGGKAGAARVGLAGLGGELAVARAVVRAVVMSVGVMVGLAVLGGEMAARAAARAVAQRRRHPQ